MTPYGWVDMYKLFEKLCCFHLQEICVGTWGLHIPPKMFRHVYQTTRRLMLEFNLDTQAHYNLKSLKCIHTEKSNKMEECIKIYYSIFIWSSTCFGRHTAHHQEPKTALAASGFAYVEICWTCGCWTLSESSNYKSNNLPRMQKPEDASAVLGSWWWAVCRPKHVELHIHMK